MAVVLALVVGVIFWRSAGPPSRDERVEQLQVSAQRAPGTEELRDAGCETALVFDGQEALEAFGPLLQGLGGFREDVTVVVCMGAPSQDCSVLARQYAEGADPAPDRFFLLASGSSRNGGVAESSLCSGLFGADGRELDPFAPTPEDP